MSEHGIEVLSESQHIVLEKNAKERFTVTKNEKSEETFLCEVCSTGFKSKQGVKQHISKMHMQKAKVGVQVKTGGKKDKEKSDLEDKEEFTSKASKVISFSKKYF